MEKRKCDKCNAMMKKVSEMKSGNATFVTFQCESCSNRKQICTGISMQ